MGNQKGTPSITETEPLFILPQPPPPAAPGPKDSLVQVSPLQSYACGFLMARQLVKVYFGLCLHYPLTSRFMSLCVFL